MSSDCSYWQTRITKIEAIIEAYEDAILALSTTKVQEYVLDTSSAGGNRTRVTRLDLNSLRRGLEDNLALRDKYIARCTGGRIVRPIW